MSFTVSFLDSDAIHELLWVLEFACEVCNKEFVNFFFCRFPLLWTDVFLLLHLNVSKINTNSREMTVLSILSMYWGAEVKTSTLVLKKCTS